MESFDLRQWTGFQATGGDMSSPAIVKQIVLDSRRIDQSECLFVALQGNQEDGHQFVAQASKAGARYALVNVDWQPTVSIENIKLLRVKDPLTAFQDIAAAYRQHLSTTVVGVTGSYGKTMVKDLLLAFLNTEKRAVASPESFNSQIGVPLSLLTIRKEHEIAIIEAGISKPGEMDLLAQMIAPDCAILTHIGDAHLFTLKDLKTTAQEKLKLLSKNPHPEWLLLPNDPWIQSVWPTPAPNSHFWNQPHPKLPHAVPLGSDVNHRISYRITFPEGHQHEGKITTAFAYYLDLVNITVKAAWLLGISSKQICHVLEHYHVEPMRTEIWKSPTGTTFINESYCSDPQSIDVALKQLDQALPYGRKVFAFGGLRSKKEHHISDYRRIGKAISRAQIDLLILFGSHDFLPLVEEISRYSPQTEITLCSNYTEAVHQMRSRIQQNDVVLIKGDRKEPLENVIEAFDDSLANNQCLINLSAIKGNLETLRSKMPPETRMMIMVKALAYGTDDIRMAKFLSTCGIDILGVSYVDEGVSLKRSGVTQDIFVINAATYEAGKVVKWGLQVGVSDPLMIDMLAKEAQKQNKIIKVHLHIDTGMSRFGCRPEEALGLAQQIRNLSSLTLEGVMTHFASADDPAQDSFTLFQAKQFDEVIQQLRAHHIDVPWIHASNSSAVMRFNFTQYNMVRIGLAAYGLYPSEDTRKECSLHLALSLTSRIVGINKCKKGESISYGRTYTVEKEMQKIAVIPIGYFDGLHRNYSGKGEVIIRGRRMPMVGRICMDFMMVDVTDLPEVQPGDSVLIFGTDDYGHYLSPEALARCGDSIVYELITCMGPRIQRIFVNH